MTHSNSCPAPTLNPTSSPTATLNSLLSSLHTSHIALKPIMPVSPSATRVPDTHKPCLLNRTQLAVNNRNRPPHLGQIHPRPTTRHTPPIPHRLRAPRPTERLPRPPNLRRRPLDPPERVRPVAGAGACAKCQRSGEGCAGGAVRCCEEGAFGSGYCGAGWAELHQGVEVSAFLRGEGG